MNKKTTTLIGVLGLAAIIIIAIMAYNWLADRTEAPDTLVVINRDTADTGNPEAEEPEPEVLQGSDDLDNDADEPPYTPNSDYPEEESPEEEEVPGIPQAPDFACMIYMKMCCIYRTLLVSRLY